MNNICSRTRRAMDVPLFLQVPHSTSPPAPEGLALGNSCKGGCSSSLPNCSTARTLSPRMLDEKQKRSIKQRRHSSSLRYQNIYPFSSLGIDLEIGSLKLAGETEMVHKHGILRHTPQTLRAHKPYKTPRVRKEALKLFT